ncbi:MAG TPA: phosphatase PAP2 family protein [Chryseolinea sp.]
MKKAYLIIFLAASVTNAFSQQVEFRDLTPVKGYYKDLQSFKPQPTSPNAAVDRQRFPHDPASAQKRLAIKPYYLEGVTPDDFEIPDPPANSSEQTRAELNYLLQLQEQRTELDVQSSLYMAGVFYSLKTKPEDSTYNFFRNNLFHIGRSIGNWFNPTDLPITADLVAHVWQDASYFIWAFKYKYLRIRPYALEPEIQKLEETNWAAYPSGHAANSYVNAYIYQELAPEFTEVFIKDAFDMAHSREIIGVHYPSDAEAARIMARQLVNKLFQNEKFLKDFALVKKEWAEKAKESFAKPQGTNKVGLKETPSCGSKTTAGTKTCQQNGNM